MVELVVELTERLKIVNASAPKIELPTKLIISVNVGYSRPILAGIKGRTIDRTKKAPDYSADEEAPLLESREDVGVGNILGDLNGLGYDLTSIFLSELVFPRWSTHRLDLTLRSKAANSRYQGELDLVKGYLEMTNMRCVLYGLWQREIGNYSIALARVQLDKRPNANIYQLRASQEEGIYIDYI